MRLIATLTGLLISIICFSQKEYHKWYFGNQAGIDFTSGSAIAMTNGAMNSTDNPATICDGSGNLLFYSNGLEVWNRNHVVMPNGIGLMGSNSGGHTATVIKKPGCDSIYYLFTMDNYAGVNGLRYSVINMNLNGGLGDVVAGQKNILIMAPASEQVVPVPHANGADIWVVTHPWNSSSFHSYLVTSAGITLTPVVSTVGASRSGSMDNALGQINVNAAGNKIATATYGSNHWELFDFDNTTGALYNPVVISGYYRAWGVEFSPNGNKLYLTGWTTQYVYQFDVSIHNQTAISNSVVNLGNITGPGNPYYTGYMQRAPDGKIYVAVYDDQYLAVVNNPDATGVACNLVDNGFYLGGKSSAAGLPNKVVVTESKSVTINLGPDTTYCGNFSRTLSSASTTTFWSTGITAAQITVTTPGIYWAYDSNSCYVTSDTIVISQHLPPQFSLPADTILCAGNVLPLSVSGATNVLWSTGATTSSITVSTPGVYWAEAFNVPDCPFRDSIVIAEGNILNFTLGNDTTLCGGTLVLHPGINNAQYVWHDNSTDTSYTVTQSGTYSVTITNQCGSVSGNVNITYLASGCQLAIPTAFSPNGDGKNDLFRAVSFCSVPKFTMRVYNRWGELVFKTDDITEGWNGVFRNIAQPVGVYVYYIQYYNNCSHQKETITGNVTLLR